MPPTKKTVTYSAGQPAPYKPTKADVRRWSEFVNWIMFEGKLPKWKDIQIGGVSKKFFGFCEGHTNKRGTRYCNLLLRAEYESFPAFYTILVHEMVHAAQWYEVGKMNHGKFFYSHREFLKGIGIRLQHRY